MKRIILDMKTNRAITIAAILLFVGTPSPFAVLRAADQEPPRYDADNPKQPQTFRTNNVVVSYADVGEAYATAIGRTVATARAVARDQFGFDMPETVSVSVEVQPQGRVSLYTDGADHLFLRIRSESDLSPPAKSGTYHLYGLCHELGHMAMYRLVRDHSWLTSSAAEGWAHYLGSRLLDSVHASLGSDLWPERYNYLEDGTRRLDKQLAQPKPSPVARAAGVWKALGAIVGDKGFSPLFAAWDQRVTNPTEAGTTAKAVLEQHTEAQRLAAWWDTSAPVLVQKLSKSDAAAESTDPKQLRGASQGLAHDDGEMAKKSSMAGGGHAVKFAVKGADWFLTEVRIHGSRYGHPQPPAENFHVWLCDNDFKAITDFPFPYSAFQRGQPQWVTLKTKPTRVPAEFFICVGFNPTATKGVFVSYDKESSGNSRAGLPGREPRPFAGGDWLIRATVSEKR